MVQEEEKVTTNHANPHERKKLSKRKFVVFVWFVVKILSGACRIFAFTPALH